MGQPRLGIGLRQASLIRSMTIAGLFVLLSVSLLSSARRVQELTLVEIATLSDLRVMAVTVGGSAPGQGHLLHATPLRDVSMQVYLPLLKAELDLYPPELIKKNGLRSVVLCGGLSWHGQPLGGTPDLQSGTMYLELKGEMLKGDKSQRPVVRMSIHHELFHMIDSHNYGLNSHDPRWEGLNAESFRYGEGGRPPKDDWTALVPDDSVAGFLNSYSRTDIKEDKAEVFSHMVAAPEVLEARMIRDAILLGKCREMEDRVRKFCPEMDDAFWTSVRDRRGK